MKLKLIAAVTLGAGLLSAAEAPERLTGRRRISERSHGHPG